MSDGQPPLRPGDVLRVGRYFPRRRLDEDTLDFLRVNFDTSSPGLARVVEVREDGAVVDLWGHLFLTTETASSPYLRRLSRLEALFAPERIGEFLLRREVRADRVVVRPDRQRCWQPVVRAWLRSTRGPLPILEALGGRIHAPVRRKAKAKLFYWLGRLGMMPQHSGFLDHGILVDRIGATVEMEYHGRERTLWLSHIRLHKNHSIHLVGVDLDSNEQRTFRLDRVDFLSVPPLGEVDRSDLYWTLQALCMSREGWLWYWNRHQESLGRPSAPPIGPVGRALIRLSKAASKASGLRKKAGRWFLAAWWDAKLRYRALSWEVGRRVRKLVQPLRRRLVRPPVPASVGPAWRRRLLRAIETIEAGGREQVTCLLPMNALLADPARCYAYMRFLMELALEEAEEDACGHRYAPFYLVDALRLAPTEPRPIPLSERRAARDLLRRLHDIQPGYKRVWIHATRRRGKDARLLLAESFLFAIYRVSTGNESDDRYWDETKVVVPCQWGFYQMNAYFVASWKDLRFRMDAEAVPRLRTIIEWWDGRGDGGS